MKLKFFSLLFLVTLIRVPAQAQTPEHPPLFNADERRIITITDERRNAARLLPYLASTNVRTAWRAAIGMGNIGDTSVRVKLLAAFLHEQRDSVADAEAFALGLLGSSGPIYDALTNATSGHPTLERLIAIARTAPKQDSSSAADIVGQLFESKTIDASTAAQAYIAFALRHETGRNMMKDLAQLANDNSSEVRWRAAYALARGDDSSDLATRLALLRALMIDQGSPNVRMFAASALGRLHNASADTTLTQAYRGEEQWQVRVNILRALMQFHRMDPMMFGIVRLAVSRALRDSAIAVQVGLVATEVVEHFVVSGTMTRKDSSTVRTWLDAFNGTDGRNEEIDPLVDVHLAIPAGRLETPTLYDAIQNFAQYNTPEIRNIAMEAAGTQPDTTYFSPILVSMAAVGPMEQYVRLQAADSIWHHAQHIPSLLAQMASNHTDDLFRGLVIHISDADPDASVVTTAMQCLQDSTVINTPARRAEAVEYVQKYMREFTQPQTRDQLFAVVEADAWLGDHSAAADSILRVAYDSANQWRDNILLDSLTSIIRRIEGPSAQLPARLARVSHIDWATLENMPPKMIINFEHGSITLRLLTAEAPLTVLNIVRLTREQFFTGNPIFRIVPNFVIQTGDPSGTGYGGPGYNIRSEFTPLAYNHEGMVGMASDGKDTEGSQWFITECPAPHLNDHYTIWAEVTSGMRDVLNRHLGERIDSMFPYH